MSNIKIWVCLNIDIHVCVRVYTCMDTFIYKAQFVDIQ